MADPVKSNSSWIVYTLGMFVFQAITNKIWPKQANPVTDAKVQQAAEETFNQPTPPPSSATIEDRNVTVYQAPAMGRVPVLPSVVSYAAPVLPLLGAALTGNAPTASSIPLLGDAAGAAAGAAGAAAGAAGAAAGAAGAAAGAAGAAAGAAGAASEGIFSNLGEKVSSAAGSFFGFAWNNLSWTGRIAGVLGLAYMVNRFWKGNSGVTVNNYNTNNSHVDVKVHLNGVELKNPPKIEKTEGKGKTDIQVTLDAEPAVKADETVVEQPVLANGAASEKPAKADKNAVEESIETEEDQPLAEVQQKLEEPRLKAVVQRVLAKMREDRAQLETYRLNNEWVAVRLPVSHLTASTAA